MPTTATHSHGSLSDSKDSPSLRKMSLSARSRSVPYKRPYVIAVLSAVLFYLCIIAFLTSAITFFVAPMELRRGAAYAMVGLLGVTAFFWLISYFKRRKATCPLCKCTPFLDNLALKHQKSFKVKPLNYGTTAILNVIFTQRWRCMYCGTPFDILKTKKKENYLPNPEEDSGKKEA